MHEKIHHGVEVGVRVMVSSWRVMMSVIRLGDGDDDGDG